jgi:hypothetical protein
VVGSVQEKIFFNSLKMPSICFTKKAAYAPKMMSIGLHQRLIGHPARAMGLKRLLDYIGGFEDIWVCNRLDIAKHWIKTHPFS